jgi:hypothetical protein
MKTSQFKARWNDYPDQSDPSMTRERAAHLIRCWKRNARKKTNSQPWTLKRTGLHSFTVSAPGYPTEFHTITWSDQ